VQVLIELGMDERELTAHEILMVCDKGRRRSHPYSRLRQAQPLGSLCRSSREIDGGDLAESCYGEPGCARGDDEQCWLKAGDGLDLPE
jgi:hypothetical protein